MSVCLSVYLFASQHAHPHEEQQRTRAALRDMYVQKSPTIHAKEPYYICQRALLFRCLKWHRACAQQHKTCTVLCGTPLPRLFFSFSRCVRCCPLVRLTCVLIRVSEIRFLLLRVFIRLLIRLLVSSSRAALCLPLSLSPSLPLSLSPSLQPHSPPPPPCVWGVYITEFVQIYTHTHSLSLQDQLPTPDGKA